MAFSVFVFVFCGVIDFASVGWSESMRNGKIKGSIFFCSAVNTFVSAERKREKKYAVSSKSLGADNSNNKQRQRNRDRQQKNQPHTMFIADVIVI